MFVACIKHPANSQSYDEVWRLLNKTLFSVCSQQDKNFRVIVVCDKALPLFHHQDLINRHTDFIEVNFSSHSDSVLEKFERLGNLSPPWANAYWWLRWNEEDFVRGKPDGYFHIANVFLNMGTKLLVGILAAEKYNPDYVAIFDGDDFIGEDISAFANANPGKNGWLMTYVYKLAGNQVAPVYAANSFCGTGNILNYALIRNFIGERVSERSTQSEFFEHVDSEFLISIANHKKIKPYFEKQGFPLAEFPTRSVLYQVANLESSEHTMRVLRGLPTQRFFGRLSYLSAPQISYFNLLASNSQKVFCLGFHKTGTTSLETLLQNMEYQVASPYKNWDFSLTRKLEQGDFSELRKMTELFDAFQDAPWFLFYEKFDQWYPGSKFILTIRDSHSWWKSFENYFKYEYKPLFKYIYGFDNPIGHEKAFVERFEKHNQAVLEYFKDRGSDLLVVNISENGALQKTSNFLGRPTSYKIMPHANASLRSPAKNKKSRQTEVISKLKKLLKIGRNSFSFVVKKAILKAPIIVGGSQFSGAEFMLAMLSSHPNIHAIHDVQLNYPQYHPLSLVARQKATFQPENRLGQHPINTLHLNKMLLHDRISSSAKRWATSHSLSIFAYQELLDFYGKGLRILNIVRDGRDVVVENDLRITGRYAVPCERWVYDLKKGMEFENHAQILTIRYEDLAQKTEEVMYKVAEFLEEKDMHPFLNYPKGAKIVRPGYWIGKWQQPRYDERIEMLYQTSGARECLQHYGYLQNILK